MDKTLQNPRYHAEGSVLAHTQMVVKKYFELRDRFDLSDVEKDVLYWAAVLHDVGKTKVTKFQNGRWTSPGHEKAGLPMAFDHLIRKSDLGIEARRQVLELVRWHGIPLYWIRENRGLDDLKVLGTRTDLRLLGIFSVFDFHGRICENQDRVLGAIEQFQSVHAAKAEYELGKFASLQENYRKWDFRHKDAAWKAVKMRDMELLEKLVSAPETDTQPTLGKKVILTIGPPQSGKTTFLKTTYPEVFRIDMAEHGMAEADLGDSYYEARKLIEFRHFLVAYLNRHRHVALDGRNLNEAFRRRITAMVREMNVEIEYLVFQAPLPIILERNRLRENPESEKSITQLYLEMELVHPWEAHRTEYHDGGEI
jgi:putative nucleotidyltransferase with HDIG domain